MRTIKFSHKYNKMINTVHDGSDAWLLQAFKIHYDDLSESMTAYDTEYKNVVGVSLRYPLPKTDLILLIFSEHNKKKLFTTIRRFTPEKFEYYKREQGSMFKVVIEEKREGE